MERLIGLSGTRNLRDLGGYPTLDGRHTRWRTLYRSDCLDQIDDAGQAWLVDAGLRTIIDLRDDDEVMRRPNVLANSARVVYRRVPIWNTPPPDDLAPEFLVDGYVRELDQRGGALSAVFEAVLAPDALPMLIHCAAGKDRTGLVIALLLAAVGVEHTTIAEDYALSGTCLGPEYVAESRAFIESQGLEWARWAYLSETPPERMIKTLAYLERQHGGLERYLAQHGFEPERLAQLRELLTDP